MQTLSAPKRELSSDWRKRLESLSEEWSSLSYDRMRFSEVTPQVRYQIVTCMELMFQAQSALARERYEEDYGRPKTMVDAVIRGGFWLLGPNASRKLQAFAMESVEWHETMTDLCRIFAKDLQIEECHLIFDDRILTPPPLHPMSTVDDEQWRMQVAREHSEQVGQVQSFRSTDYRTDVKRKQDLMFSLLSQRAKP